ncbi:Uncharacterised protein [Mycobacterium tuberculosis]|nr:Uncharacterised protein [Mycobacterium tuberculosis]
MILPLMAPFSGTKCFQWVCYLIYQNRLDEKNFRATDCCSVWGVVFGWLFNRQKVEGITIKYICYYSFSNC